MATKAAEYKTAAIYARYSSVMQKETSIEGQKLTGDKLAKQNGLSIVAVFSDSARSGKSVAGRDGYAAMVAAIKRKEFDVVITEDLNRLSRDGVDPGILKRACNYYRVGILTQKGWQSDKDIAIHGLVSTLDNESRAINVKRGQELLLTKGLVPGAVAYGYRSVPGKPGVHEPDPVTSKIVQRIFYEYGVLERSPRDIAADLTREGIPTPASHRDSRYEGCTIWNHQAFVGGMYAKGILGNRKYIGEIEWNTHTTEENPDTRRKVKRPAPKGEHTVVVKPEMRIIDQDLWDAAQAVRTGRAVKMFGKGGRVVRRPVVQRGDWLLSGMLRCGSCNGHMRIAQKSRDGTGRVACAAAHQHRTCEHTKTYDIAKLMAGITDSWEENLASDEAIKRGMAAWRGKRKSGAKTDSERKLVERKLNALNLDIDRLVDATMKMDNPPEAFFKKISAKEVERASLDERLHQLGGPSSSEKGGKVVPFVAADSPKFREIFRQRVMQVHHWMVTAPDAPETMHEVRNLIDSIVVHPTGKRMPYEFTPYVNVAALEGLGRLPAKRSVAQIAAENGHPAVPKSASEGFPASSITPIISATWSAGAPIICG